MELFRPTDALFSFSPIEAYVLVWGSGRGFSDVIDTITEVLQSSDGQLHCKAIGKFPGGQPRASAWELTVGPDEQYRVTHAKCLVGTKLGEEMRNEGTQNFARGLLPVRGTFSLTPGPLGDCGQLCYEITFLGMSDSADADLISYNRTLLRNLKKGQSVTDFRSGVAEAREVGEEEEIVTPKAHSHGVAMTMPIPHSRAHLWYLIMAANAFLALLWAVWRYRKAKGAERTS